MARAEWLHKLPAQLTWTQAALVEPFTVAYAAVRAGVIDPSDRVAVLGGGPIGLLSAMAAVGRNAAVTLIEPRPDRRAKAAELGVSSVLDPGAGDVAGQARELTGGELFDVVIESAGHPEAMAQALTLAGNHGRIVYVGIDVGSTVPAELGLIQARSLRIQGIVGSAGIWPQAIRFLGSGVVDPTPIVTARYPLGAATDALGAAALGSGNIKVHIEAAGVKAAVFHAPGTSGSSSVPEPGPAPGPGELLIRVSKAALCGTDSAEWDHGPLLAQPPVVLGHEFTGTVIAAGPGPPVSRPGPG